MNWNCVARVVLVLKRKCCQGGLALELGNLNRLTYLAVSPGTLAGFIGKPSRECSSLGWGGV